MVLIATQNVLSGFDAEVKNNFSSNLGDLF